MMDPSAVGLLLQRPHRGDNIRNQMPRHRNDNFDRREFLNETKKRQRILIDAIESNDEDFPLERNAVQSKGGDLQQGFLAIGIGKITEDEYNQGCTAVLLSRLFEQGQSPSDVISCLSECLNLTSSYNGNATAGSRAPSDHSLLSLVLLRGRSEGISTVDLNDSNQLFGIVTTIQERFVALNDPTATTQRFQSSTKVTSGLWVIPLVYIVGYTVYNSRQQQPRNGGTLSWNGNIREEIIDILNAAFPMLRPTGYIDVGLVLLQLDLLQEVALLPDDIHTSAVVAQVLEADKLRPLALAARVPRCVMVARCCHPFLCRLDVDGTNEIADACKRLMRKENPLHYLKQMNATPTNPHMRRAGPLSHRDELLSPGYPLMTQIDVLLLDGQVENAIGVVVKMEKEGSHCLTKNTIVDCYFKIFRYLVETGRAFLDSFADRSPEYCENRRIILDRFVTIAGDTGVTVFLNSYENLLEQAFECSHATAEELNYLCRAVHQTILRVLQAKTNEDTGMDTFWNVYWKRMLIKDTRNCELWSEASHAVSTKEQQAAFAYKLLLEKNEIPESLCFPDDSRRPDLAGLLRRGQKRDPVPLIMERAEAAGEEVEVEQLPPADSSEKIPTNDLAASSRSAAKEETIDHDEVVDLLESDEEAKVAEEVVDTDDDASEDKQEEEGGEVSSNNDDSGMEDVVVIDDGDEDENQGDKMGGGDEPADEAIAERLVAAAVAGQEEGPRDENSDIAGDDYDHDESSRDDEEEGDDDHVDGMVVRQMENHESLEPADEVEYDDHDDDGLVVSNMESHETAEEGDQEDDHKEKDGSVVLQVESHESLETVEEAERGDDASENHSDHQEDEAIDHAGSQSMDEEAFSQTGYEPEGTEEEVSEAIHTEDEEEEQRALERSHNEVQQEEEVDPKPPVALDSHTLSDMDAADEQGNESSELDEGEVTDPGPPPAPFGNAVEGESKSLVDYAKNAQRLDQSELQVAREDMATNVSRPSVAWHWSENHSQNSQQPTQPQDLSVAVPSDNPVQERAEVSHDMVVVDHVPESFTPDKRAAPLPLEDEKGEGGDVLYPAGEGPKDNEGAIEDAGADDRMEVVEQGGVEEDLDETAEDVAPKELEEAIEEVEADDSMEVVEPNGGGAAADEASDEATGEAEKARQEAFEAENARQEALAKEAEKARLEAVAKEEAEAEKARQEAAEREAALRVEKMEEVARQEAAEKEAASAVEKMEQEAAEKDQELEEPLQENLTLSQLADQGTHSPPRSPARRTRKGASGSPGSLRGTSIDVAGVASPGMSSIAPSVVDDASEGVHSNRSPVKARRSNRRAAEATATKRADSPIEGEPEGSPSKKQKTVIDDAAIASAIEEGSVQNSTSPPRKRSSPDGNAASSKRAKRKAEPDPMPPPESRAGAIDDKPDAESVHTMDADANSRRKTRGAKTAGGASVSSKASTRASRSRATKSNDPDEESSRVSRRSTRSTRAKATAEDIAPVEEEETNTGAIEPPRGRSRSTSVHEESLGDHKGDAEDSIASSNRKTRGAKKADEASVSSSKGTTRTTRSRAAKSKERNAENSTASTSSTRGKPAPMEEEGADAEPRRRQTRAPSVSDAEDLVTSSKRKTRGAPKAGKISVSTKGNSRASRSRAAAKPTDTDDEGSQASGRFTRASRRKTAPDEDSEEETSTRSKSSSTRAKAKGGKRAAAASLALTAIPEEEEAKASPATTRNTTSKTVAAADNEAPGTTARRRSGRASKNRQESDADSDVASVASSKSSTGRTMATRKRSARSKATATADSDGDSVADSVASSMTVIQLKAELKRRGLKTSGKKAELIARLEAAE